ncbi:MAG: phosphatase [Porcipelethomonas sp.]
MLIEADLHCHSLASSHAYSTVKELAESAAKKGLKAFALTDHAPMMPDAPHIWHFHNIRILPREICGITVIKGVEANVKSFDGDIDMTDFDLRDIEWVVASCHLPVVKPGTVEENTHMYLNLIKNKWVDAIGHCTTKDYPIDFEKVVKACRAYGKFIEINESSINRKPGSQENAFELLKICRKHEAQIVVNTDSHYCDLIGETPVSQMLINETDFPKELIFNSNADNVIRYINEKKTLGRR